ncbi:hypothetical protein FB451DRAFT_1176584 [Mycena latifolia]|nr:hypothetical protein FB451DRAFT_1176584 [Mycena latifolia]
MSAPAPIPPPDPVFTGALDKLKKPELQSLCLALGLEQKDISGKKKESLISLINTIFDAYPSYEEDSRFAGLFKHRKKHANSKPKKTSAVKDAEDAEEQSNPSKPLTGAALKLLNQKVTTDPSPSFRPLNLGQGSKKTKEAYSSPLSTPTPSSSPAPLPLPPAPPAPNAEATGEESEEDDNSEEDDDDEEDEDETAEESNKEDIEKEGDTNEDEDGDEKINSPKPNKPIKDLGLPKITQAPTPVLVRFSHPTDNNIPTQTVFVKSVQVTKSETEEGQVKHEATLTELLPLALNNHSPMKADRAGRLLRAGVYNRMERMPIGSIGQHTEGGPPPANLEWTRANTLTLESLQGDDNVFGAQLYYEPSAAPNNPTPTLAPAPTTSLTGAQTDVPIEIAQQRQAANPVPPKHLIQDSPHFRRFILEYTEFTSLSPTTNMTAGQALDAYLRFIPLLEKLKGSSKGGAGWAIPSDFEAPASVTTPGWEQYRNGTFTQKEVILASGLKLTSTRQNYHLFQKAERLPGDIAKWVKAPRLPQANADSDEDTDSSLYEDMKLKDFTSLVEEKTEERKARKAAALAKEMPRAGSSKRKKSEEGSEEQKKRKKKKKNEEEKHGKGKAKAKARRSSEELDKSSSDA